MRCHAIHSSVPQKLRKIQLNLSFTAVVIGALRINTGQFATASDNHFVNTSRLVFHFFTYAFEILKHRYQI